MHDAVASLWREHTSARSVPGSWNVRDVSRRYFIKVVDGSFAGWAQEELERFDVAFPVGS